MLRCCVTIRIQSRLVVPLNFLGNRNSSNINSPFRREERTPRNEKSKLTKLVDTMNADRTLSKKQTSARAKYYIKKGWAKTNTNISNIIVYVLGSGAVGAPKCLYLATDNKGYLFNCGESSQRLTLQLKLKLTKLQDIFVTQSIWENTGGITGLMLSLQEAGIPQLDVHGPPGVGSLLDATKKFTTLKTLEPVVHDLIEEGVYDDGLMKIRYFPIFSTKTDTKNTEKLFLKIPRKLKDEIKKKQVESAQDSEEELKETDNANINERNVCGSEQDYYDYMENPSLLDKEYSSEEEKIEEDLLKKKRNYTHHEQKMSMCYFCQSPKILGALDLEACVDRNVPPGPLFGKLKNKQDITLPDGTVIHWKDVTFPDTPGTCFLVMDCPGEEYLDSLIQNEGINKLIATEEAGEIVKLVVHFSPPSVMNHPKYKEWMNSFNEETQHLRLNSDNTCIGTPATHRIQTKLNFIHPGVFPLLANPAIPVRKKGDDFVQPDLIYVDESNSSKDGASTSEISLDNNSLKNSELMKSENNKEKKSKIIAATTMLMINLKKFKISRDPQYFVCPDEYLEEAFAESGTAEAIEELKQKLKEMESSANPNAEGDYPKVIFLGTGSSSPKNLRNTSGILVFTSPDSCMLLDCGEGTYQQIVRLFGRDKIDEIMLSLKAVYVSHLHADHHLGFIGILKGRRRAIENILKSYSDYFKDDSLPKSEKVDKLNIKPLYLLAPPNISPYLKTYDSDVENILEDFIVISNGVMKILYYLNKPEYIRIKKRLKVRVVPVPDVVKYFLTDLNLTQFKTCLVRHCYNSFGVSFITNSGYKISYSGDSMPCGTFIEIGLESDLLIHEATMDNDRVTDAARKLHSTVGQAVEVGQQMKAKFIMLTHFSQRYAYIPRYTETLPDNVGVAFDNMVITAKQLPLISKFLPALRLIFAEQLRDLEGKFHKSQLSFRFKQKFLAEHCTKIQEEEPKEKKMKSEEKFKMNSC